MPLCNPAVGCPQRFLDLRIPDFINKGLSHLQRGEGALTMRRRTLCGRRAQAGRGRPNAPLISRGLDQ